MVVLHTAIAIIAVIVLIIRFKVDPVISLIIGSLYLGLAAGVSLEGTVTAITKGFGNIMTSVGLLIGFGVLMGALLHATGAFRTMVRALLRAVGPKRLPYALTTALATIFPSIYVDVQVVLAAPVARQSAPHVGKDGLAWLAGALGTGIFCGYVFVVPGLAAISIAGLLSVPLGTYMLFGIIIGPLTAILTTFIFRVMLRFGWWKAELDEEYSEALAEQEAADADLEDDAAPATTTPTTTTPTTATPATATPATREPVSRGASGTGQVSAREDAPAQIAERSVHDGPPLLTSMLPILVPLLLIAFGALADLFGFSNNLIAFIGNANIALFIGLVMAYLLARTKIGVERTGEAFSDGLHTTGEILLVTGIGGSLGAVIKATPLADVLSGLFGGQEGIPLILALLFAWFIAALLHLAIGSVSVAAITAAGILAPILGTINVSPVAMGLAIASGSLFALQVNSNFFWMFKALLGLSTRGSLKTMTTVTSIASVISLPPVLVVGLVT